VVGIELSGDETLNHKPHFLLRKCAKTHLQQCGIQKFSGGEPPDSPLTGEKGERRGREQDGSRRRREGEAGPILTCLQARSCLEK